MRKEHHSFSLDILFWSSSYSVKELSAARIYFLKLWELQRTSSTIFDLNQVPFHPHHLRKESHTKQPQTQQETQPNMQAYRIAPCARRSGCGPTSPSQTVSAFFPIIPSELTPLLRLLETPSEAATAPAPVPAPSRSCGRGPRSKNAPYPRFDVKETAIAFELQGEFPGFQHEDISIDFIDAETLVIRGHTAGVVESKNQTSAEVNVSKKEKATTTVAATESPNTVVDEEKPPNSYKVMVEDEDDEFVDAGVEASDGEATPATSIAAQPIESSSLKKNNEKNEQEKDSKPKYWIHERPMGRFERGFRFPSLVDRDNVKANLKDGILSIVVPKVERKERRIVVE